MRTLKFTLSGWQSVGIVVFTILFFSIEVNGKSKATKSDPVFTQFTYQGIERPVTLQVTDSGDDYRFNYSTEGTVFTNLGGTVSGDILSTNMAGEFTGAMIGLYATSAGK